LIQMLTKIITYFRQKKISPPSPSFFEMTEFFKGDDVVASLTFPLKLMQKYGGLCKFPIAPKTYLVSGAKEMEEILKTKAHNFSKDNFLYRRLQILFGKSLLVTDGAYWKQRRKIAQPAFQMTASPQSSTTTTTTSSGS